jgi:hypothetical protein
MRKGNGALDWVAVMASQRIGPPYGLDSDLACRQERSETLRVSRWGWQAAHEREEGAVHRAEEPPITGDDE